MQTEQCEPVLYPPTPEEIAAASRDPLQARVVRPREVNPAAPAPNTPAARVVEDFDLTAYTYRGPEAGVMTGGLRGRWYVSLTDSGSVAGRRVRPRPVVLDVGQPLQIFPRLASGSLTAVIALSGSTDAGRALIDEWAASPEVVADITAARIRNPHLGPVGNGRFPVTGSGLALVGCTLPKIVVNLDGLDNAYREQADPLWRAGVARMDWIFSDEQFLPDDVYRQVNWTLTETTGSVSGSWELWPYGWADPGYDAAKRAISTAISRWSQPSGAYSAPGDDAVALNRKRLVGFFQEITPLWNRINADSNTIRGLQIAGGNTRITRQPIRFPEYNGIPTGNSVAPAESGSVTTSAPTPTTTTTSSPAPTPTPAPAPAPAPTTDTTTDTRGTTNN